MLLASVLYHSDSNADLSEEQMYCEQIRGGNLPLVGLLQLNSQSNHLHHLQSRVQTCVQAFAVWPT